MRKRKQPTLKINGHREYQMGHRYDFDVESDMCGLISVTYEAEASAVIVAAATIIKNSKFHLFVEKMPHLKEVTFSIIIRPQNEDLLDPAVSKVAHLSIKGV